MHLATLAERVTRIEGGEVAVLVLSGRDLGQVLAAGELERCGTAAVIDRPRREAVDLHAAGYRPPRVVCSGNRVTAGLESAS